MKELRKKKPFLSLCPRQQRNRVREIVERELSEIRLKTASFFSERHCEVSAFSEQQTVENTGSLQLPSIPRQATVRQNQQTSSLPRAPRIDSTTSHQSSLSENITINLPTSKNISDCLTNTNAGVNALDPPASDDYTSITYLEMRRECQEMKREFKEMRRESNEMLNNIHTKLTMLLARKGIENPETGPTEFANVDLLPHPVLNIEMLKNFDHQIKNDNLACRKFIQEIKTLGGRNLKKQVGNIMRSIMTDEVAVGTTWTGARYSFEFRDTEIAEIIIATIIGQYNQTKDEIKSEIARWLTTAGDRIRYLTQKELLRLNQQRKSSTSIASLGYQHFSPVDVDTFQNIKPTINFLR